ncbi:MAG: CmpA/NrtA family ABC transporter substrate-binding protein [Pseudomonadota bacterium]
MFDDSIDEKLNQLVPAAEKYHLEVGYLRLTDAAPFVVAQELGMFDQVGLNVELRQEISWANIRDKLVSGALDAAQMLAPLPAMITLGASGLRAPILTGLVLSNHGNAITLSQDVWQEASQIITQGECASVLEALHLYARQKPHLLTFATVHAFSSHTLLLRRWLSAGGIDPDRDIKLLVVPPSQMVDSLQTGVIDGYCVGEPWNTIGVKSGMGVVVALGSEIWPGAPEKVLGVSASWHQQHPQAHLRLRLALLRACQWLADSRHTAEAARILSLSCYLDMPVDNLLPSLTGELIMPGGDVDASVPDFHLFFGNNLNCPDFTATVQMIEACAELLGRPIDVSMVRSLAAQSCRADLYKQTTAVLSALQEDVTL